MKIFDHLIFDLDDTLLDTYGQLVPQASKEACARMIESGLNTTLEHCLDARHEIAQTLNQTLQRADLFKSLVQRFGVAETVSADHVARVGFNAFYDRKVESHIALFPGIRDALYDLKDKYELHLVTAGHPDTQEEKLQILDLKPVFDSVTIVNTFENQEKSAAFQKLARLTGALASRHLSIGNRLDTDIAPAKRLGWQTCWVRYGEYARATPANDFEKPEYTISSIKELITTCRL